MEALGSRSWPRVCQGVFLWTLRVCTLGFWVPKPVNMALNKGIWGPKLRYKLKVFGFAAKVRAT